MNNRKKDADTRIDNDQDEDKELNFGSDTSEYDLEEHMLENYTYPSPSQDNFQEAIYTKRDFYIHSIAPRKKLTNYDEIKEFRDEKCAGTFKLSETQSLLSNFINPNTPYRGVLIYHGTGVGKTCAAVAIAEKFKPMVEKYATKIHVLVPGPLNKQNFLNEIVKCTGETYTKIFQDKTIILNEAERNKIRKNALNIINQYYRVMSYRSFYKKVLGEKIREKVVTGNKVKLSSKKTETGEYERDLSIDRIYNLDNTLLIIDEAHNITGNEFGNAVKKIIDSSKNLRVILLSATPMKNLADSIVELINYLRPKNSPMERDKIFTSQRGSEMDFKPGGRDYLRKMSRGYVSFLRGADPLTFAERVDIGEIPPGLDFTKVTRCFMLPFQLAVYDHVVATQDDSLDRNSEAVANFVFPGLPKDRNDKGIQGYYGIKGINEVKNQLRNNSEAINRKLANTILSEYNIDDPLSLMYLTDNGKSLSGDIFHEKYLKHFSIKFYTSLQKINTSVYGKRGAGLIFVYLSLVKVGIGIFQEILQRNGYLEFQENSNNYNIRKDTRCYFCEHTYGNHSRIPADIPEHDFYPATYITVTGKSEDDIEQIPEEKHRILKNIFNNVENREGKYIKIVVGSKVMNEGITLSNIKEIHILDVHFNLGRVDQAIGRGIRFCTHYNIINQDNAFPKVEVNKYVVSIRDGLSTEEQLYKKAELKYKLIKQTERILQEEAIDCPLNISGNIFPEEMERYRNCGSKNNPCPAICGYMSCEYKCGDKLLNAKYYDPERNIYKKVAKSDLDYTTYNNSLASDEINYSINKIKEMYRIGYVYTLRDILKYVKKSYPVDKRDMFDDYYVYQAVDNLIPITGNDFNNFTDTIMDKYNRPGYLIYKNKYYIFQPFDQNEDLPMYYRRTYQAPIFNKISIKDYVQNTDEYTNYVKTNREYSDDDDEIINKYDVPYDFDSIQDYYDDREEFEFVGIIDKESKKSSGNNETVDEFKIRKRRPKILSKKRETGIPSFKGAVCKTSKDKKYLISLSKKLNIQTNNTNSRVGICDLIRDKLFDMEKYTTDESGNKMTYLIVPANHPTIPFPLNLQDRMQYIIQEIERETRTSVNPQVEIIQSQGDFDDIDYFYYRLIFNNMNRYADIMRLYGGVQENDKWIIIIK
ncbi:putative NTPase [Megavirus courdo11]|uniref:DEAD-like helicase n=4 Tax=Megamimivirinae TaxID=3044648 RepID=A0A2L2DMH1_MIMIV|nr:putative NTPase [Megavirus chiliensis]AEX61669.1 putative NTPase [Megavirus courdo7]AFX92575.1 putative NTPase [Megavirus courdo11]AVG47356.1 DEAD-like helicase [Acanthamoeba polyphaga mimivirus]AVL93842.1 putative NTPase [Megavirus vitis]AEQ32424.1 putative ATP-dependent RNA helicase [Megavirus chiliensis]